MTAERSEHALLVKAARHVLPSQQIELTALPPGMDWSYAIATAGRHGLLPLLFDLINSSGLGKQVPLPYYEKIKTAYLSSLLSNQKLFGVLCSLLDSFSASGIQVIVMKGPALCMTVYEDTALRPFGDLDLLLASGDITQGQQLLEGAGYSLIRNNYFPVPDERNAELGCEWSYHRDGAVVELHWDLIDRLTPFDIDISHFWEDPRTAQISGREALVMKPESQLLHLCLHEFKHHWAHLRSLVDVSLLLDHYGGEIDWERAARSSRAFGTGRTVYYTLILARRILGTSLEGVPINDFIGGSPGRTSNAMIETIAGNIFAEHLPRRLWELMLVDGTRARLGLAGKILAHPFPRGEEGNSDTQAGKDGRMMSALKSLYFYRRLLVGLSRQVASAGGRNQR